MLGTVGGGGGRDQKGEGWAMGSGHGAPGRILNPGIQRRSISRKAQLLPVGKTTQLLSKRGGCQSPLLFPFLGNSGAFVL